MFGQASQAEVQQKPRQMPEHYVRGELDRWRCNATHDEAVTRFELIPVPV